MPMPLPLPSVPFVPGFEPGLRPFFASFASSAAACSRSFLVGFPSIALCCILPIVCNLVAAAAARALISAYEPFLGALAFGSGVGFGFEAAGVLVPDKADDAVGRAVLPGKEDDVGEGLPLIVRDGFLEADNADLSVRGRGVLLVVVGVGLADPVYPEEGRSARRLGALSLGLANPFAVGVVRGAFWTEPPASPSAFLFADKAPAGLADGAAVDFSPVMEARRSPICGGGTCQLLPVIRRLRGLTREGLTHRHDDRFLQLLRRPSLIPPSN